MANVSKELRTFNDNSATLMVILSVLGIIVIAEKVTAAFMVAYGTLGKVWTVFGIIMGVLGIIVVAEKVRPFSELQCSTQRALTVSVCDS